MEGLRNYQAAQSGFAGAAEEMNENAAAFRGKKANIIATNKSLVQQARSATDLNALKGIGEEAAVRAFKTYGGKALGAIDKKVFSGNISKDTEAFKSKLEAKGKSLYQSAKNKLTGKGDDVEDDGETGTEMTGGETDVVGGETPSTGTFGDGETAGTGEVEDVGEMPSWSEMTDAQRETELFGRTDDTQSVQAGQDKVEPKSQSQEPGETKEDMGDEPETKEGDMADDAADDVAEDAGEDVAEGAGEGAVDEGVAAGLEGAGTALDATGIGAIVGVPLQIAGAVLEGGALYEAGKSLVDWFETDILGEKPKAPQVAVPTKMPSLAQKGLVATPIYDSSMDMPSSAAAF